MTDQVNILIPKLSVNEGSAFTATAYFRDRATSAASAPGTAKYRVDNLTTCRALTDWTSLTPAESVSIAITATHNAIQSQCNKTERVQLTVASNPDTATQARESIEWEVMNISGF